jgi:hypothetical protein
MLYGRKEAAGCSSLPCDKDGLIYTVDSNNNLMCIEASTGKKCGHQGCWLILMHHLFLLCR